nr:SpoIIE family protein phosphatase [Cellulomonas sp. IC4_254]
MEQVVRVVGRALGAEAAQVSLLTDTRTVAATTVPATVGSTADLADAVCTITAATAAPLVVTDAREDPRLRDLPPVAGGRVRSYLGVPLVDTAGHVLGSLCVYGPDVRGWSTTDVHALQGLATTAVAAIEAAVGAGARDADRLTLLAAISEDLAAASDVRDAVRLLARRLVPAMGSWCVITLADEQGALEDLASWHADPEQRAAVARYAALRLRALTADSMLHEALGTGRPVAVRDGRTTLPAMVAGQARAVLVALAPDAAYAVPMRASGRVVGVISLYQDPGAEPLTADDLATLVEVADHAARLLGSARQHERHREIAETLQRALLPDPASPPGVRVAARYRAAASAAQVGGDWYDVLDQGERGCLLVVGDVMGHDTLAAAAMSQVRTLLRGVAHLTGAPPAVLLGRLDDTMAGLGEETMATAVVVRVEPTAGTGDLLVRWASAGHLPPLLATPDGEVRPLAAEPELVLGCAPGTPRVGAVTAVPRGSLLLMHTDGLVERRGEDLRAGSARLAALVRDRVLRAGGPAAVDPDRLLDEVLDAMLPAGVGEDDVVALVAVLDEDAR